LVVERNVADPQREQEPTNRYEITAVAKALDVLEALQSGEEMTLEQIFSAADLPKSTTFRILSTLESRGYVERGSDERRYKLAMKLLDLSRPLMDRNPVRRLALPQMRRLSNLYGETINLGMLSGPDVIYIDIIDSHHPFRVTEAPGSRSPIYSTALGKAIAAFLPRGDLERIISQQSFRKLTETTITTKERFMSELRLVAVRGYAMDDGEGEAGVRCVAAPIRGAGGYPIAAISLSAPAIRFSGDEAIPVAQEIGRACHEISGHLGFHG
jgi:DNA-binding IclR family transcriptional regulator